VSNLVSNALMHAAGAPVAIETRSDGLGNAIIRVIDRGPGIDEGRCEQIFKKFSRAVRPECTVAGFGIGLWVARHLAMLHGGSIAVESTLGVGATLIVALPIALYAR
jgi:signal transduction histidine kinase